MIMLERRRPHLQVLFSISLFLLAPAATRAAQQTTQPELELQAGHANVIWAVAVSPNSRLVASGGLDHTIKIWSLPDGRLWRTLQATPIITALAFSHDGRLIAAGSEADVLLVDVATGATLQRVKACDDVLKERRVLSDLSDISPSEIVAVAFNPAGTTFVTACDADDNLKVWDIATGQQLRRLTSSTGPVERRRDDIFGYTIMNESDGFSSLLFDSTGRWLASGNRDRTIRLWDFQAGTQARTFRGLSRNAVSMALSPDSRFLTASDTRTAAVWRFESAQLIQNVPGAWSTINSQGRWLTADKDGKLTSSEIGNAASGQDAGQLKPVPPAHLSPDGRWLIGADREKLVTLDLRTGTQKSLFDFDIAKRRIVMSRDGNLTALAPYFSNDRTVSLKTWNLKTGEFRTLSGPGAAHAVFSHDNRFLAAAADDKAVQVWDAATAQELKVFSLDQTVGSVSLNGTGQWLAASSYIGPTQIWEVESGRIVRSHPEKVFSFATFSPDSRWMARSIGSGITITDATTGQETHTVKGSLPLAFSNDTRLLATGAGTGIGQIQIWNVSTGEEVRTIKGDFQILREIKFSPDRRWLATRADDDEVTLWDLEGGKAPRAFSGYTMGFITGGSFFWVTGPDGITRFWSKEESKLVASLALIEHSDDWAVITPEGRFDGTTRGIQTLVAGRNGDRILSADQFMQRRMPGLLTSLFAR